MPPRVPSLPPPFVSSGEGSSCPFRKEQTEREDFPDRKRFSIHLFGIRGTNVSVVVDDAHRRTRRASSRSSRRHASCGGRSGAAEAAAVASAPLRRRRKKRGDEPRRHGRQNRQERQLSRADVRDHARRDVRNATVERNELTAKDGDGRTKVEEKVSHVSRDRAGTCHPFAGGRETKRNERSGGTSHPSQGMC